MKNALKIGTGILGGMGVAAGGAKSPTIYLDDKFTTDAAAPLTSPRTCEPGPGTLTITDTTNKYTISGGVLTSAGRQADNNPSFVSQAMTRQAGKTFLFRVKGSAFQFGIALTTSLVDGLAFYGGNLYWIDGTAQSGILGTYSSTTYYDVAIVQLEPGAMVFIKGGAFADWTLFAVGFRSTGTTEKVYFSNFVSSLAHYLEEVSVFDADGGWSKRYPFATDYESFPVSGASLTANADCVFATRFTPAADSIIDVCVRYLDADNHWIVRFDVANTKIDIIKKEGGVEGAPVATVGSVGYLVGTPTHTFHVSCHGQTIKANYSGKAVSYGSAAFQETQTGVKFNFNTGTCSHLAVFPKLLAPPAITDAAGASPIDLYLYGDSKMAMYDYRYFQDVVETHGMGTYSRPERVGRSGATLATFQSTVDADLSTAGSTITPDYVFVNIGVNDVASLPVEATFKTNYGYVLDAIHTKWPTVPIKVAYVWQLGQDANSDILNGWITTVLSSRSWATVGLDERVTIKAGDDGATNTTDGTHYSAAGQAAAAAEWIASLGL